MKIKSTDIKAKLEKLNKDITHNWIILRTENLVDNGFKRHYDMKGLLDEINKKAIDRIQTKLDQLCINLGIKSRKDFPKESIYPIIFELSEKNEQFVQLGILIDKSTINPILKMKKGKKNLKKNEELTHDYLTKLKNNLQLEINGLKKKLTDYNENAELDTSSAYMHLAA